MDGFDAKYHPVTARREGVGAEDPSRRGASAIERVRLSIYLYYYRNHVELVLREINE